MEEEVAAVTTALLVALLVTTDAAIVREDSAVGVVAASPNPMCEVVFFWRISKQPLEISSWQHTARTHGLAPELALGLAPELALGLGLEAELWLD